MIKKMILAASLACLPILACAQTPANEMPAGDYQLDKTHASLTWKVSHMGLSNYTARFTRMDATLNFDPKDPTKSKLVATVDPTSVRTDYPNADKKDFDAELAKGETWFNAGKFPEIKFVSTSIDKTGEKTGKVHGNLTFLGVTKPLTLDVTFNGAYAQKPMVNTPGIGFSATAKLKRSDWGFSTYIPTLGDEVTLLIEVEFDKAQ
ncbi:MAG: YceI family protein [Rickettsiales bacterium]|nr:YceI family protein [Rickettsiales bacterium]